MRTVILLPLLAAIAACGGPTTRPETPAEEATPGADATGEGDAAPPRAPLAVSWQLFQPMRIAPDGLVSMGERTLGRVSGGTFVRPDGVELGAVRPDGAVTIGGEVTRMRLEGLAVYERGTGGRDERVFRIDGDQLVMGDDDERVTIVDPTPSRHVDVLLVSVVILQGMAAGAAL